jgi:hypothetical protein
VGRAGVLSPREWALISDWYDRSIPLAIIEEAIQQVVMAKSRRGSIPRSLGYIAAAVEEAWGVVQEGRRIQAVPASAAEAQSRSALVRWRERAVREPAGSPLSKLLHGLLERHAAGAAPEELDRDLAAQLPETVSEELLQSTRQAVERQLVGFRERMDNGIYGATRRRAIVARLRRALELPPIAE